eukprot:638411-Pyramimonas_sp.AAC.2
MAASASAPSCSAEEFASSLRDETLSLLCAADEVRKVSAEMGSGKAFGGPLPAWGNLPRRGA